MDQFFFIRPPFLCLRDKTMFVRTTNEKAIKSGFRVRTLFVKCIENNVCEV